MARPVALNESGLTTAHDKPTGPVEAEHAAALLVLAKKAKVVGLTGDGMQYTPATTDAVKTLDQQAALLADFDPTRQLTDRNQALAFWINLYNAMVIHAALSFGVRKAMTEIPHFFKRAVYRIGHLDYNLDVIEHGLLRANRGHPLRFGLPQLLPWDPRRSLVLRPFDPRIHFALNCGAVSCPPIRSYSAKNMNQELNLAARSFVSGGGVSVDPDTGRVLLSRIFLWYARDFGWTKRRQLAAAMTYMDDDQKSTVTTAAANGIGYADYDWSFA